MLTLTLFAVSVGQTTAELIPFDAITPERAAEPDGRPVTITFTSARVHLG